MELLGEWVIGNPASVRLEIVLVLCNLGARFAPNVPQAQKSFWMHLMIFQGDEAQVEAYLSPFGDSANLDAR
jgi:hypothetical protein